MFDVITVPIDGSEYGYKAADVAIEIAQKFDSKIAAVHVLEEFSFSSYDDEEDSGADAPFPGSSAECQVSFCGEYYDHHPICHRGRYGF